VLGPQFGQEWFKVENRAVGQGVYVICFVLTKVEFRGGEARRVPTFHASLGAALSCNMQVCPPKSAFKKADYQEKEGKGFQPSSQCTARVGRSGEPVQAIWHGI